MTNKYIRNNGNGNFKVTVPFEINTYNSWFVETKIAVTNTLSNCVIMTTEETDGSNRKNFKVEIENEHLKLSLSYNGNTYITETSSNILNLNNIYYIKLEFTGVDYILSKSLDGIIYENYIVINNNAKLYSNSVNVIFIPTIDGTYFNGKLDINSTKLIGNSSTIFDGSTASSSGYLNKDVIIVDNIASSFSQNNYIQYNGFELKDYVKIIMHINITDPNTKQILLYNNNNSELYIDNKQLCLKLDDTEIRSLSNLTTGNYYIGYVCSKNNQTQNYEHKLYYMLDDGFYSDYTKLPDFSINSISYYI